MKYTATLPTKVGLYRHRWDFRGHEHYVHCYSHETGEYVGWFLFIPYNGSVAESFADWTTGSSSFDRFLSSLTEELDT